MGLYLEGECTNKSCVAYHRTVIMNIGVPVIFKLGLNTLDHQTNCPMCNEYVKPITCAFNNCYYRYIARIEKRNRVQKIKSDWIQVDNYYSRFNEDNQVSYASLVIETKQINEWDRYYNLTEPVGCCYCLSKFESKDTDLVKKNSKEKVYFHLSCKSDLEKRLI